MKTVIYKGIKFDVSNWVNFIATDKDGQIIGYENKPIADCDQWIVNSGMWEVITTFTTDWENSLEEI